MSSVDKNECSCFIDTPKSQGCIIKILVEVWEKVLGKETDIDINKKGIFLTRMDPKETTLISTKLFNNKFREYRCEEEIPININLKQFLTIVKNIKKKDSISLFIRKNKQDKMSIAVSPENLTKKSQKNETWTITVQKVIMEQVAIPEEKYYKDPINIPSTDFQKMCKKFSTSGSKTVSVKIQGNTFASFFCSGDDILDCEVEFGNFDDSKEAEKGVYKADFHVHLFTQLIKLPGLAEQMSFYAPKKSGFPLKIAISAGMLGEVEIFLKDKKQIEYEDSKKKSSKMEASDD